MVTSGTWAFGTHCSICILKANCRVSWLWYLEAQPAQVTENMVAVQTRSCQNPTGDMEREVWESLPLERLLRSGLEHALFP